MRWSSQQQTLWWNTWTKQQLEKAIAASRKKMLAAAKDMDFWKQRDWDEMFGLQKLLDEKIQLSW